MENYITSVRTDSTPVTTGAPVKPRLMPQALQAKRTDSLELGENTKVTQADAMHVVYERALEKLRNVVSEARAELGLPEEGFIDTSDSATADRIADFAIGMYDKWIANRKGVEDSEATRKEFAQFIGNAVSKGIEEARGILTSLKAMTPGIDTSIGNISNLVNERLNAFVAGIAGA